MHSLSDRTALVCGSTQGIGFASAVALAERGASIVLAARDAERLRTALASLPCVGQGQRHSTISADFADPLAVQDQAQRWTANHGPMHILINNTGGPPGGPILEATPDQFLAAFRSHLLANHLLARR